MISPFQNSPCIVSFHYLLIIFSTQMPRIHQLDVPLGLSDGDGTAMATADKHETGSLLDLDDGSDEDCLISRNSVVKNWQSSTGGAGCFAVDFHGILGQIGKTTGTKLLVLPDPKGIEVSGRNDGDVNDALERLTRVEKPLVSPRRLQALVSALY